MTILLTGASGFIGSHVLRAVVKDAPNVIGRVDTGNFHGCRFFKLDIDGSVDYSSALIGVDVVIHCAAKAHSLHRNSSNYDDEVFDVNTHGTLNLALQAAKRKVKRFIFISSIGVNGSFGVNSLSELDKPNPQNIYSLSKLKAEQGLLDISQRYNMDVVIIRPPLVYGSGAPGNFNLLTKAILMGLPLPFGLIDYNKRSFVAVDNLVDFVLLCANYENSANAANEIFLISDGESISTSQLLKRVAKAYRKKLYLIPVPSFLLRAAAKILGKKLMAVQLLDSLSIDSSKSYRILGWKPVISMQEQLDKMYKVNRLE